MKFVFIALALVAVAMALPVEQSLDDVELIQSYSSGALGGGAVGNNTGVMDVGKSTNSSFAKGVASAEAKAPVAVPTPAPPSPEHLAQIKHYINKIKEFQKTKNQKWDPFVEQDLAEKLALVDSFEVPTAEELDLQAQLRKGDKPYEKIEMSLRKFDQNAASRKAEKAAEKAKGKAEVKAKQERKLALARENKEADKQIAKYRKLAVSKQLEAKAEAAKEDVKAASKKEAKLKRSKHYKSFAKEHEVGPKAAEPKAAAGKTLGEAEGDGDHIIQAHIEKVTFI